MVLALEYLDWKLYDEWKLGSGPDLLPALESVSELFASELWDWQQGFVTAVESTLISLLFKHWLQMT